MEAQITVTSELNVKHLFVSKDGRYVLRDVSTSFETGSVVMVIGPNGSGKSTFLRALAGLVEYQGEITVSDVEGNVEESTGYVFQNPETQIVGSTVFEDVIFGLENIGLGKEEMERRAEYVLRLLELWDLRYFDPYYLSGGQKQRLAIASVLALQPKFLLLDEVTAMLDRAGKREVLEAVVKLRDSGNGVVVATHELELFASVADRALYLNDGVIKLDGAPEEVIQEYRHEMLVSSRV